MPSIAPLEESRIGEPILTKFHDTTVLKKPLNEHFQNEVSKTKQRYFESESTNGNHHNNNQRNGQDTNGHAEDDSMNGNGVHVNGHHLNGSMTNGNILKARLAEERELEKVRVQKSYFFLKVVVKKTSN